MAGSSISDDLPRWHYIRLAKLSAKAERYDDMATYMTKHVLSVTPSTELTAEERNLLSIAYKNVVGFLRAGWRKLTGIEEKEEESKKNDDHVEWCKGYRARVESELGEVCERVLKLVEENLLPSAVSSESKVFCLKMKGDFSRYLAEFKLGDERQKAVENTMNSYKSAQEIASDLSPGHPIRLGLNLNYSVFYCDVLNSCDKARDIAKQAFDECVLELDSFGEELFMDSNLILRVLRDNLVRWT